MTQSLPSPLHTDAGRRPALRFIAPAAITALALALSACGGGSEDPTAQAPSAPTTPAAGAPATPVAPTADRPADPVTVAPAAVSIKGVAATGAPLSGATIRVFDATGTKICETTAGDDGAYACELGIAPKAPFVVQAELDDVSLLSALGEARSGTVNITPITHLITATLSSDGDPKTLMTRLAAGEASFTAESLRVAVERVVTALKPLTDALGATMDPIQGSFAANGSGHDKVLDALQISIRPDGTSSNVEVTVKARPTSEDAPPVAIAFRADATTVPALPSGVDLSDVSTVNVPAAIADLSARMKACYALPVATRVSDGANPGSTVVAAACRGLFHQDDPTTYLSNGARVGPSQGAAFGSLFKDGATGLRWEAGTFDFRRANGDWVVSYRVVLPDGTQSPEQVATRLQDGRLKLIGNQYAYAATVRPIVQRREHLNSPDASNLTVGYNVHIANRIDGSGNPVFAKVEVTTPRGNTLTYVPNGGLGYLTIVRNGTTTATPVIRLAGRMLNPALAVHPGDVDTSLFFADRAAFDEAAIRSIPDQSVWKLEFFHADGVTPNVVQSYRTTARASTLAEASRIVFPDLVPGVKNALRTESAATGYVTFADAPSAQDPQYAYLENDGGGAFWAVPPAALPPTTVTLFGRAGASPTSARFNDGVNVPPSARKVTIRCSALGVSDTHCAAAPYRDQYATGTVLNMVELWARDSRQREVSSMTALYRLTLPTQP